MKLNELIEKHRPLPEAENLPAGSGALFHLNNHGLIGVALVEQIKKNEDDEIPLGKGAVITRLTAWEVLAEAQRNGLRIEAKRLPEAV